MSESRVREMGMLPAIGIRPWLSADGQRRARLLHKRVLDYEARRYDAGERCSMADLVREDAFEAFDIGDGPGCSPFAEDNIGHEYWLRFYHEREMGT